MPTPFYHLSLAEGLLDHPALPEPVRQFLHTSRSIFLFGSTSPDVQVVSGQSRQSTHFFNLPIQTEDLPAWERLLVDHPDLADPGGLPTTQAVFMAGYLCHLQADWLWVKDIFTPFFGPYCSWGSFSERLYLHNVLRAYLDERILPGLHTAMDICLSQVEPDSWLPFVEDYYLCMWRDYLFHQLEPGATSQTVEVFSSRQGISTPEFHAILASEERMQTEVFEHLPLQRVQRYHQQVLDENSRLLSNYLAFTLHQLQIPFEGIALNGVQI